MVLCLTKQGNKMTGFCLKWSQGLKVFCVEGVRFFLSQLVKCSTILYSLAIVRLLFACLGQLWGWEQSLLKGNRYIHD